MIIEINLSSREAACFETLRANASRDLGREISRAEMLHGILRAACVKARIVAGPPTSERKRELRAMRDARMIPGPDDTARSEDGRW